MSRIATFNESRTFGIEIEFTSSLDRYTLANALQEAGINASVESYNHSTQSYWKIITDASCGNEIVSPVLKGYEGIEEVRKVCSIMNQLGAKVDKKCGLHVHHYAGDLKLENFKNLYISYAKYENLIDSLMPNSRRGNNNNYCKSMIKHDYEHVVGVIKDCSSIEDIGYVYSGRYYKLNIKSYVKYGTIEFRQHAGTTDANKIVNWIMLSQLFVERSKFSIVAKIEREYDHLGCLYNMLGIVRKNTCSEEMFNVGKFFRKRQKELNKREVVAA